MTRPLFAPACVAALLVMLAACQPAVRPDLDEPAEPESPVTLRPTAAATPSQAPAPEPAPALPDPMDTGAACRTYNVLAGEGRAVAAALIAV